MHVAADTELSAAPSPRTRHLKRSIEWNMLGTLLPDANVGIVIGVLVCRFESFSFGSFCNAIAIEMRPGVWLHALFLSDVPLANLKWKTDREWKNALFSYWSFVRTNEKKLLLHAQAHKPHIHTNTPKRSWVKYLYTKWTFRRIMLLRLILCVLCACVCTYIAQYPHRFFSIRLGSMVLFGVALMRHNASYVECLVMCQIVLLVCVLFWRGTEEQRDRERTKKYDKRTRDIAFSDKHLKNRPYFE